MKNTTNNSIEPTKNKPKSKELSLEDIVRITNKVGLDYADAKKEAERLDLLKASVKARIGLRLAEEQLAEEQKVSEVKLRRLIETDEEFIKYLQKLNEKKSAAEKLRIRYDSYKNLFEARRSMLSYQKAEMSLL